jgi:membrane peptidoglycan carboxypeptidase
MRAAPLPSRERHLPMYLPLDPEIHAFVRTRHRRRRAEARPRRGVLALTVAAVAVVATAVAVEVNTSWLQARLLSAYAGRLTYTVEPGASDAIRFPEQGPFDERLGYARLPMLVERLQGKDLLIEQQARFSPALLGYTESGFFPPFVEKGQAGLTVADCRAQPIYQFSYPQHGYARFDVIPTLVVQALLFIENRELLDPAQPSLNPAIDWVRFSRAAVLQLAEELGLGTNNMGGSTLATQIEKYRHSSEGITWSVQEKLRQMVSGSVRAYAEGPNTLPARQRIVLDYINTVPLSAAPGHGEVHGLGDGLHVWFDADFHAVSRLLRSPVAEGETLAAQGLALRQVVALMIAQRRPSYYLAQGRTELAQLTDSYLRLMTQAGEIDPRLRDAALAQRLQFRDFQQNPAVAPMPTNKGVTVVRSRLSTLLDVPVYELDRLDLAAGATLNRDLQAAASAYLSRLRDPEFARQMGLIGDRLLSPGQPGAVRYSFTLFERTPSGNRVRVQTDNTDQPFDINEGSKLELGSTAKLRVLATYLEVVGELHTRYAPQTPAALRVAEAVAEDPLSRWALSYLRTAAEFRFTSALPVQALRGMAPLLLPHLEGGAASVCADASYLAVPATSTGAAYAPAHAGLPGQREHLPHGLPERPGPVDLRML